MASKEDWKNLMQRIDQVNVDRGLLPYFRYFTRRRDLYPYVDLEKLIPPFEQEIEETELIKLSDHLIICINEEFLDQHREIVPSSVSADTKNIEAVFKKRRKAMSKKSPSLTIKGFRDYQLNLDDRLVTKEKFPIIYEALLPTDDAFIIHGQQQGTGLYLFRARIEPPKYTAEERLRLLCKSKGIKDADKSDPLELTDFYNKIESKFYEILAWPSEGRGTKHLAAGRAAVLLDRQNLSELSIGILSGSGVYSRTDVEGGHYFTRHIVVQPLSKFRGIVKLGEVPPEYVFTTGNGKKRVLFYTKYLRNNNYSIDACWVDIKEAGFLNPKDLSPKPFEEYQLEKLTIKEKTQTTSK